MTSSCYSWISNILNHIRGNNDVVFDGETSIILKKQPLLQPPKPDRSHRRRRPLILRYFCPKYLKLYIIDGDSEKECSLRGLDSLEGAVLVATCNELILLSSSTRRNQIQYGVFKPLSNQRKITIINSPNLQACGFFFHPPANEYRILAVGGRDERGYEYQIYSFNSRTWRQTAKPYFRCRPRCYWKSDDFVDGSAAIVNNALHWFVGQIMVFDMVSEEFEVKVLPFEDYVLKLVYFDGYLSTKGDELCFCVVGRREPAMEVWVCDDYENWCWSRKFIIDLSWDLEFPVIEPFVTASYHVVRVVGFEEDEVMLFWRHRGLFVYNLKLRSVERVWVKKLKLPKECRQTRTITRITTLHAQLFLSHDGNYSATFSPSPVKVQWWCEAEDASAGIIFIAC